MLLLVGVMCTEIGLIALLGLISVLRPRQLRDGSRLVREHPLRCLGVGLLACLAFVGVGVVSNSLGDGGKAVLLLPLFVAFLYWILFGMVFVAADVGDRVQSNVNTRSLGSGFASVLWGGVVLALIALLPIVGQGVIVLGVIVGLGAAVSLLFMKREKPAGVSPTISSAESARAGIAADRTSAAAPPISPPTA